MGLDIGNVLDIATGGLYSGITKGKGILGGAGGALYGEAGANKYQPEPFMFGLFQGTPVEKLRSDFVSRDAGRGTALDELERNRLRKAPQAQGPGETVQVSGYSPERYGGATINQAGYNEQIGAFNKRSADAANARTQQMQDLGLIRSAALGQEPSVAEQQLREGMDRQIAAQASWAAGARGGPGARASAARRAALESSDIMADTNRQAAALRADEMEAARSQLLAGNEALRGGDINQQGVQLNAAGLALQPGLQQAQLEQQARMQGIDLSTQAGMQALGLQTQADLQTQQLQNNVNLANLTADLQSTGLQNQYSLGLLGRLGEMDRTRLMGTMGYAGALTDQDLQERQQRLNEWTTRQQIQSGVAGSNAQSELIRSSGGLGFLSGLTGGIGAMAAAA